MKLNIYIELHGVGLIGNQIITILILFKTLL
jgi:hypothetical protein